MTDWAPDDGLPLSFDSDPEDSTNAVQAARLARIEASRQQARAYSAKIDQPNVSTLSLSPPVRTVVCPARPLTAWHMR